MDRRERMFWSACGAVIGILAVILISQLGRLLSWLAGP